VESVSCLKLMLADVNLSEWRGNSSRISTLGLPWNRRFSADSRRFQPFRPVSPERGEMWAPKAHHPPGRSFAKLLGQASSFRSHEARERIDIYLWLWGPSLFAQAELAASAVTKGRPVGNEPTGNFAMRSPARYFSAASSSAAFADSAARSPAHPGVGDRCGPARPPLRARSPRPGPQRSVTCADAGPSYSSASRVALSIRRAERK
jgi:hypothetical protein